jgi:hypothetical protein
MNERLKLISGQEPLVLDPTDGKETLGQSSDVFRYIDHNFERWHCTIVEAPTKATAVQVYGSGVFLLGRSNSHAPPPPYS